MGPGVAGGDRGGAAGGPAAGPGPVGGGQALSGGPGLCHGLRAPPPLPLAPPRSAPGWSRGDTGPAAACPAVPYGLLAAPCPPRPREEAPRGAPGLRHTGGRPARPRPCRPRWLPGFGLLRPPWGLPEGGFGEGTGGLIPCGTRNLGGRPRLRRSRCLFTPRGAVLPGLQPNFLILSLPGAHAGVAAPGWRSPRLFFFFPPFSPRGAGVCNLERAA